MESGNEPRTPAERQLSPDQLKRLRAVRAEADWLYAPYRDECFPPGEIVWIRNAPGQPFFEATVVHVFAPGSFGYPDAHYVLEVKSIADSHLRLEHPMQVWASKP